MKTIKCFGSIKDSGFYPRNPQVYYQQLEEAGNVHDCLLTIEGTNRRTIDQNSYCWAMFTECELILREKGFVEITKGMLYKGCEDRYCWDVTTNEKTGQTIDVLIPLKEQEPDRFWEIVEDFRIRFQEKHEVELKTPAQHYGISEKAYDLLKLGAINYTQAKKLTDKELDEYEGNN